MKPLSPFVFEWKATRIFHNSQFSSYFDLVGSYMTPFGVPLWSYVGSMDPCTSYTAHREVFKSNCLETKGWRSVKKGIRIFNSFTILAFIRDSQSCLGKFGPNWPPNGPEGGPWTHAHYVSHIEKPSCPSVLKTKAEELSKKALSIFNSFTILAFIADSQPCGGTFSCMWPP